MTDQPHPRPSSASARSSGTTAGCCWSSAARPPLAGLLEPSRRPRRGRRDAGRGGATRGPRGNRHRRSSDLRQIDVAEIIAATAAVRAPSHYRACRLSRRPTGPATLVAGDDAAEARWVAGRSTNCPDSTDTTTPTRMIAAHADDGWERRSRLAFALWLAPAAAAMPALAAIAAAPAPTVQAAAEAPPPPPPYDDAAPPPVGDSRRGPLPAPRCARPATATLWRDADAGADRAGAAGSATGGRAWSTASTTATTAFRLGLSHLHAGRGGGRRALPARKARKIAARHHGPLRAVTVNRTLTAIGQIFKSRLTPS